MSTPLNLILFYTGNGKGKTTAALGLAARALRERMKVDLVQFVKSASASGEVGLKKVLSGLKVKCFGLGFISLKHKSIKTLKQNADSVNEGIKYALRIIKSGKFNVLILDEIFVTLDLKLVEQSDIIKIIKEFRKVSNKSIKSNKGFFLIMTGRGCPKSLYKYTDLVTEMKEIKHPFSRGVRAVRGVDY